MKVLFLLIASIVLGGSYTVIFLERACSITSTPTSTANISSEENSIKVSPTPKRVQWIPPTYLELKLGKSTIKDVKKIFGNKPWFEGEPEEKAFDKDPEDEILLQFNDVLGTKDNVDITVGKKTKIVKAVTVYPAYRQTKQELISQYGSDFFEIESGDSMCIEENHQEGETNKKMSYPIVLIYPQKGMYVLVQADNRVNHIGYLVKCPDAK